MIKMEFKKYNYGNQPEKETEKNRKEKSQTKSSFKNTYFSVLSEDEYTDRIKEISVHETLENIHPSCARKLIEQCKQ